MRASGFGWSMLLRPLFNLLLPVSAFALISALFLAPVAAGYQQHRLEEAFRTASEWGLQTGQFHVLRGGELGNIDLVETCVHVVHCVQNNTARTEQFQRYTICIITSVYGITWNQADRGHTGLY